MSVRGLVYKLIANDPALNGIGLSTSNVFANGAPDSPPHFNIFAVLRWGPEVVGTGGQRGRMKSSERECSIWVYDKNPDYTRINSVIRRWCEIMEAIEAKSTGVASTDGYITQADWNGDGEDAYDDIYEAWTRPSTYTIIASGD